VARRTHVARADDERSEARERALSLIYEAEAKSLPMDEVVAALPIAPEPLVALLVGGVERERDRIDALITRHARGWTMARMAQVDRAVLRIATFELIDRPDVPVAVVLDEAVELAKRFSTDDSGRFVNGVLAAIAREARPKA
jgi:transcription antitermination protein NusB